MTTVKMEKSESNAILKRQFNSEGRKQMKATSNDGNLQLASPPL